MKFAHIKVGDFVTRMISETIPMRLAVTAVDEDLIWCGPWAFRRDTGGEVDDDLGWDGVHRTGSRLRETA